MSLSNDEHNFFDMFEHWTLNMVLSRVCCTWFCWQVPKDSYSFYTNLMDPTSKGRWIVFYCRTSKTVIRIIKFFLYRITFSLHTSQFQTMLYVKNRNIVWEGVIYTGPGFRQHQARIHNTYIFTFWYTKFIFNVFILMFWMKLHTQ